MTKSKHTVVGQRASDALLAQGIAAARAGQRRQAHGLFTRTIKHEPDHEQAWMWLAFLSESPRQARACLRQSLRINPRNRHAVRALRQLTVRSALSEWPSAAKPSPRRVWVRELGHWLGICLLIATLVIVLGSLVAQAWLARDGELRSLVAGSVHVPSSRVTPAAVATATSTPSVSQRVRERLSPMQPARAARDWETEVHSLQYTSYLASSRALLAKNHLHQARDTCEAALKLNPDSREAQALLRQIHARLALTPTPTPQNPPRKRIEVSISKQRMYVWEGETLLHDWVCSTGEWGRSTATGRFEVLDKIPEAWASTWSLRMPYWLGIYYVGSIENGIHALPILPNGQTLWDGYLGSRVSYGCVILSAEHARILYDWADVGTPVWIHD